MKIKNAIFTSITMIFDAIGALFLCIYSILLGPIGFLRGPFMIEKMFWYFWVFLPMGAVTRFIRVSLDWRLGLFDVAVAQMEGLIEAVEARFDQSPNSLSKKRVLLELYTLLARGYMHSGHIDEAMQVVLRAKRRLTVERLPGLTDLDAKTANLVRAGLAAGKLLDGAGVATLFVKSDANKEAPAANQTQLNHPPPKGAKIIPFPQT